MRGLITTALLLIVGQATAGEQVISVQHDSQRGVTCWVLNNTGMEALKAQKAHTFLADVEVFQNPRTLERWAGDGPIRKTMWVPAMKKAGVRYRGGLIRPGTPTRR